MSPKDRVYYVLSNAQSRYWTGFAAGRGTQQYMRGQCFDFALALLEKLPDAELVGIGGMEHVALRRGDFYYDVRGALTEADFRRGVRGGEGPIDPVTREDVAFQAGLAGQNPPYKSPEMTAARKVVRQYVQDLGITRHKTQAAAAPAPFTPTVGADDGDVPHAHIAYFDDAGHAYIRFWQVKSGALVIQSIEATDAVRGRDMLRWLQQAYGRPVIAVEATPQARGFWERMKKEGLVQRFHDAIGWPHALEKQSVPLSKRTKKKRRPPPR